MVRGGQGDERCFEADRELEARKRSPVCRSSLRELGGDLPKRIFVGRGKLIAQGKATLTIAAGVLKFSRQVFYTWLVSPVSDR